MSDDRCPHCHEKDQGYVVKAEMRGHIEKFYNANGDYYETNMDRAYLVGKQRFTVRCANCSHIRRDVQIVNDHVVRKITD